MRKKEYQYLLAQIRLADELAKKAVTEDDKENYACTVGILFSRLFLLNHKDNDPCMRIEISSAITDCAVKYLKTFENEFYQTLTSGAWTIWHPAQVIDAMISEAKRVLGTDDFLELLEVNAPADLVYDILDEQTDLFDSFGFFFYQPDFASDHEEPSKGE